MSIIIPNRIKEGYGLTQAAIQRAMDTFNPTTIITVDCGVNSHDEISYATSKGIVVVVTDHHEPGEGLSKPFALINPKVGQFRELDILAGVGVVFKLIHALIKDGIKCERTIATLSSLRSYMDIAALGTVADMVPLIGENRILVKHGLETMASTKWVGLKELIKVCGIPEVIYPHHVGFKLGPRINAVGRIGDPQDALTLLTTNNREVANEKASILDETNAKRREIEAVMVKKAIDIVDSYFDPEKDFGLVVSSEGWHPGIVGIVASRIVEKYNRPAIILGVGHGMAKGSCRSIPGFNLLAGLTDSAVLLSSYGGHKVAAGLALKEENLAEFKTRFNEYARSVLEGTDISPIIDVDAIVSGKDINWEFYEQLKDLQPFGQGIPEPIWQINNMSVVNKKVIGANHLKLILRSDVNELDAIIFNYPLINLPEGNVNVVFTLNENTWRGNTTLQLMLKDIKPVE